MGMSEGDIQKINSMYNASCNNNTLNILDVHLQMLQQQQEVTPNPVSENYLETIIKWFESILGLSLWNKKRA